MNIIILSRRTRSAAFTSRHSLPGCIMVARSQVADSPSKDRPSAARPEDTLAEVAEMRAHGQFWKAVAEAVGWDLAELRRALCHDPNYPAAMELALREAEVEAAAEMLHTLRGEMRSDD